jgi:peroxiredoxin
MVLLLAGCKDNRFDTLQAPDFSLASLDGEQTISLASRRGELVYLTVWASWCVPCRREMPFLNTLYHQFRDKGFTVIAVNVDEDQQQAREFLQTYPVDFPVLHDPEQQIIGLYGVTGLPSHFLIAADGVIVDSGRGFDASYESILPDRVRKFLPN